MREVVGLRDRWRLDDGVDVAEAAEAPAQPGRQADGLERGQPDDDAVRSVPGNLELAQQGAAGDDADHQQERHSDPEPAHKVRALPPLATHHKQRQPECADQGGRHAGARSRQQQAAEKEEHERHQDDLDAGQQRRRGLAAAPSISAPGLTAANAEDKGQGCQDRHAQIAGERVAVHERARHQAVRHLVE